LQRKNKTTPPSVPFWSSAALFFGKIGQNEAKMKKLQKKNAKSKKTIDKRKKIVYYTILHNHGKLSSFCP